MSNLPPKVEELVKDLACYSGDPEGVREDPEDYLISLLEKIKEWMNEPYHGTLSGTLESVSTRRSREMRRQAHEANIREGRVFP